MVEAKSTFLHKPVMDLISTMHTCKLMMNIFGGGADEFVQTILLFCLNAFFGRENSIFEHFSKLMMNIFGKGCWCLFIGALNGV